MKLFTIGDSISQGFMSGAAARTDQSFSTILAKVLEAKNYNFPQWNKGGMPNNIEEIFRRLQKKLGPNIKGPIEWTRALDIINRYIDDIEDYYERGEGYFAENLSKKPFDNVSIRGFDVAYSWLVNPSLCEKIIEVSPGKDDNWWGIVDQSLLRTAKIVLETGSKSGPKNPSQIDWLKFHHENEGVENLFLWLGANNALGTVLDLDIIQTSNDGTAFINGPDKVSYQERIEKKWNLWHPEDFKAEYKFTLDKIVDIMISNPHNVDYKIFVATVPLVTICPLIKAAGTTSDRDDIKVIEWDVDIENPAPMDIKDLKPGEEKSYSYAKYYPYFAFAENFDINTKHLNQSKALHIDNVIRKYNRIIQELVAEANKKLKAPRIYLVDISSALSKMALKRNKYDPTYDFPEYFKYAYPKVDTRYCGTNRDGTINSGGIFSLDGVHPTAIGQGLIAYEFLKVMKKAGSFSGDVEKAIDWHTIFNSDSLYSNPIGLLGEIYENIDFKKWLFENVF